MRTGLITASMILLAACSGSSGDQNLGASTGNSLTLAQIDAALGPENQPTSVNSPLDENAAAAASADVKESSGNEAGLARRHIARNAAG